MGDTEVRRLQLEIVMDETGAIVGAKNIGKANKTLEKSTKKTASVMSKMTKFIKSNWIGVAAVVAAAIGVIKKAFDFTKAFSEYRQGMDALSRNTGKNADNIVAKLKEVSRGTISNKDIMLAANRAVALNVTQDMDQVAKLMEIARVKGKAMGIDTTQAFNDMVTGIGRGSPLILDNLGIITKGWDEEAKAAGKAMDTQFILNKILKQGGEELKRTGANVVTNAEKFQKFKASMADLALTIGKVLTPVLLPLVVIFTKVASVISIGIQKIAKFVGKLIGVRKEVANINAELAKPILLRLNERRILQLQEGIDLTKQNIREAQKMITTIKEEAAAVRNGTKSLKNVSQATRDFLQAQRSGITNIDAYTASIEKSTNKVIAAQKELKGLQEAVKKQITPAPEAGDPLAGKKKENEELKGTVADFFAFVDEQRKLDLLKEQESYAIALEGLAQFQLSKEEIKELEKIKNEETRQKRMEDMLADNAFFEQLERQHQKNLTQIESKEAEKKKKAQLKVDKAEIAATRSTLSSITSLTQSENKTLFAIGKAASVATAVINTIEAVTKTMASTPFPLNISLAALQGAAGAIQISKIKSQTMEEGGSIHGPSHAQGGTPIEAEGGEFMVRKSSVTASTLPLLNAINNGISGLAGLSVPVNRPSPGMQAGGVVSRDERRFLTIERVDIASPDPAELFEKLMEVGEDMGVDIARRG